MAGDGGPGGKRQWADLPDELLGTVYLRSASTYDRARFAAVCTSWRASAACHRPLQPLPLLLPSTGDNKRDREALAYSPEAGRALRIPRPWFPQGNRLVGSHDGGWIATASVSEQLTVVNLFSGHRASLPRVACACPLPYGMYSYFYRLHPIYIKKIIFSADPSSSSCILAAITKKCNIALCRIGSLDGHRRIGSPDGRWTTWGCDTGTNTYTDIAFCNGELYGFTDSELFKFNITVEEEGNLVISQVHTLNIEMTTLYVPEVISNPRYIFELHGELAIAVEVWPESGGRNAKFIRVFMLADGGTMWEEVTRLDDHALFLGPAFSKAVPVSCTDNHGVVKRNHIYYSEQRSYRYNELDCSTRLDIGSCTVYCCESQGTHHLEKILSWGYHYPMVDESNGCNVCLWLLPLGI